MLVPLTWVYNEGMKKGQRMSEEQKLKIGLSNSGNSLSAEHKQKIRIAHTGKKLSPEHKARIRASHLGANNHFYGKKHSKESLGKMSIALKGKFPSEETRRKLSEARKGRVFTDQTKKRISLALKGKNKSLDHRKKMSESRLGKPSGKRGTKMPPEFGEKISRIQLGRKQSTQTIEKRSNKLRGKKRTEEQKLKTSGKNHYNWKGGITPTNQKIRHSSEYKLWRTAVFERDNYTCVWCGSSNINRNRTVLNADHVKPFALFPELRFAIDNGRTLCVPCHKTTDTYGVH